VPRSFFTIVLGGTAALHTYRVWGAVIFYVVQHRGIEPTEGFSDLVSGGSQGAVASGGFPLGSYLVIRKDLGGGHFLSPHRKLQVVGDLNVVRNRRWIAFVKHCQCFFSADAHKFLAKTLTAL